MPQTLTDSIFKTRQTVGGVGFITVLNPYTNPYKSIEGAVSMTKSTDWEEIGSLTKKIRQDLMRLDKLADEAELTRKQTTNIRLALNKLERFRSVGEGVMLSRNEGNFDMFYGDSE